MGQLTLRPAAPADSSLLREWRNDPVSVAFSLSPAPVSREDHERWFAAKLDSADCAIWIAELAGEAAGQVRLVRVDAATAEISFSIAPDHRGQGLGTVLLGLLREEAGRIGFARRLVGRVIATNEASRRAFLRAGFAQLPATEAESLLTFAIAVGDQP